MSLNGIWKIEMVGINDWEATATAFLEDGRYLAGSSNHYAVGTYKLEGSDVVADVTITAYNNKQVLFGKKASEYNVQFHGKLNGNVVDGEAKEGRDHLMRFKATRIAELP